MEEAAAVKQDLKTLMRGAVHSYIEYAIDYASAGMYDEALQLLSFVTEDTENTYPMVYYALGYFSSKAGKKDEALAYYQKAEQMCPDYCFPNKLEEVLMLQDAMTLNPTGSKAPYYLGNFHYAVRCYDDAVTCWETSVALDDRFPTVLRNLSLAYYNKQHNPQKALAALEKAYNLDTTDARILMELDQLYKKLRYPHRQRLDFLEAHANEVEQRDDLCIERITLYNQLGEYQKAYDLINSRKFHPWEGGEGKVTSQYVFCRVELAKQALAEKRYADAVRLLKETEKYPDNLGEGKLSMAEEMIFTIGWDALTKDWKTWIRRKPTLNGQLRVRQNRLSRSSITTSSRTRFSIRDWLGANWVRKTRRAAVLTVLSSTAKSICSTGSRLIILPFRFLIC